MSILISEETFKVMTERIQEQTTYIKELEKANEYKDKVISELNKKYASKKPSIKEQSYGEE